MNDLFVPEDGGLTIVLDRTASMTDCINALKRFLPQYVIRRYATDVERLTLVTFDDHYEEHELAQVRRDLPFNYFNADPITAYGTTGNLEEYAYWLTQVRLGDGSDDPEAIACALQSARRLDPTAAIWLVTDAIPHGVSKVWYDRYPEGCPCGVALDLHNVRVLLSGDRMDYLSKWYAQQGCPVARADLSEALQETELVAV